MRPHARIRKAIRWGGAVVTVLLVVVWVGSTWIEFGCCNRPGLSVFVSGGYVVTERTRPLTTSRGWVFPSPMPRPMQGWYWRSQYRPAWRCSKEFGIIDNNGEWSADSLLRWASLAGLLSGIVLWWMTVLDRRAARRLNICPKCRYDRTGLGLSARCPECGSSPAEPAAHA
jgi:hypothetical protein